MTKDWIRSPLSSRTFWLLVAAVAVVYLVGAFREINRPFQGLHAWGKADGARFARAHVVYGLGYTRGIMTEAMGNPPPAEPHRYVNHPQMSALMSAGAMWLFGTTEGVYRGYWALMSMLSIVVLIVVLRGLLGGAWALLAGLVLAIFPVVAYFGTGGHGFLTAMLALMFYLKLLGEAGQVRGRRGWLWVGLIASNFICVQLSWTGAFYSLALFVHYLGRCIFRRQWPGVGMLAALAVTPLLSAVVTFGIMLANFGWDFQRVIDLYKWRSGTSEMTGQMESLTWGYWLGVFWQHARTNFGLPVLVLGGAGLAVHAIRRVWAWHGSRGTKSPVPLIKGSPQLLLLLMPGVLQLLILRGTLIKHQYWELPLAPILAVGGVLCLLALWDLLRRMGRVFAGTAVAVVLGFVAYDCVRGANYYYDIRWQHDGRIALWKELNRLTPPDKALLTFDPVMDGLIVTQSEAKGQVVRAEPAWYIDRPIDRVPTPEQALVTYQSLAQASARLIHTINGLRQNYQAGRISDRAAAASQQTAIGQMELEVKQRLQKDLPAILDALRARRQEAPIYLLPGELGHPQILPLAFDVYLDGLRQALDERYAMVYHAPAQEGQADDQGRFFKAGMRSYYVYDLRRGVAAEGAQPQPPPSAPGG